MDSDTQKQLEEQLKEQKAQLEHQLSSFAKKDPDLKDDWDSKYPHEMRKGTTDHLEEAADEVEEYATRLPIEHSLEEKLQLVNKALEKIDRGAYGTCEQCENSIDPNRLKAAPEAPLCEQCIANTQQTE